MKTHNPNPRGNTARDELPVREAAIRRALVVDDDSFTMKMVGQMLEALGHRVDLANGSSEAREKAERQRYQLVITDFQMPEMDGYALACWLKERWHGTRVFIMTGCSSEEVEDYRGADAVDRWMYKPFDLVELQQVLDDSGLSCTGC